MGKLETMKPKIVYKFRISFIFLFGLLAVTPTYAATKAFSGELKHFYKANVGESYYYIVVHDKQIHLDGVSFLPIKNTGTTYKCYYTGDIYNSPDISHCNASSISGYSTFAGALEYYNNIHLGEHYYYITASGHQVNLANTDFYPSRTIGTTYKCYYTGTIGSNPTVPACGKHVADTTNPPAPPTGTGTCSDKIKNGDETGVDTGGRCDTSTPPAASTDEKAEAAKAIGATITPVLSQGANVETKGCAKDNNAKYTTGLLTGVYCNKPITTLGQVIVVVRNIMNQILVPSAATLFTIMIIIGGIVYMTANGNEQRATKAKGILTAAIIGLLITLLAYVLVFLFAGAIGGGVK